MPGMPCVRCGGFVVRERCFDNDQMDPSASGAADRCLNCGAIEDTVILASRRLGTTKTQPRFSRGSYHHHP